jgi:tetratricopeptide (TPR) repeat protein
VPIPIELTRGGYTGPVTLHFEGLPVGVSLPDLTISAGRSHAEARAVARPDAAVAEVPVKMVAWAGSWRGEGRLRLQVGAGQARELESRGFTLLACGRPAEAVAALTRALEAGASDPALYHNRGVGYTLLNQLDRALADYSEAIRLDPSHARAYEARARVYLQRGDVVRSQADAERAAELTRPDGRAVLPPPNPSPPPPHNATGHELSR